MLICGWLIWISCVIVLLCKYYKSIWWNSESTQNLHLGIHTWGYIYIWHKLLVNVFVSWSLVRHIYFPWLQSKLGRRSRFNLTLLFASEQATRIIWKKRKEKKHQKEHLYKLFFIFVLSIQALFLFLFFFNQPKKKKKKRFGVLTASITRTRELACHLITLFCLYMLKCFSHLKVETRFRFSKMISILAE